ncbi:tyrosine--tRNA ligase [Candidatus Bathyarchaeota archaeon]|nr:tyrosine--tRNA ligase [Candidatus Bathyarchaeota archaeon]
MDLEEKLDLIKRPPTEEIVTEKELHQLLETKDHPEHYIGFEISGLLHVGTFLISSFKVNDLAAAGVHCRIYLADWHSFLNNKMGGNWDSILSAGKYYDDAFRFMCPKAEIVLGSELYANSPNYWKDFVRFSKNITLSRNTRCLTIMGRTRKEKLDFAQYLYPPMQGLDVAYLGPDLPHGGMDQRKAHILAREVLPKLGLKKPVALHHHLLTGLAEPSKAKTKLDRVIGSKMSKSKPWTAVFINDSPEEIRGKLRKAWCPEKIVELNPVLELANYIVFHERKSLLLERPTKFGGNVEFGSYDELESSYMQGKVHPQDLKDSVAREIADILEPIRRHFDTPSGSRLLDIFEKAEATR